MRYWFTTHWPALEDGGPDWTPGGVWVPDGKLHVIQDMAPGDLVWIYEARSGPPEERSEGGGVRRIKRRRGRMDVVALVEVTEPPKQLAGSKRTNYAGHHPVWWRYHAGTRAVNTGGFIGMRDAATLLRYSPSFVFRGFGGGSGLKMIAAEVHADLLAAFTRVSDASLQVELERTSGGFGGPGGEGEAHRQLKKRIADDPAQTLGEPGLRLFRTELRLDTNDRVDVVLVDALGRLVAVEGIPEVEQRARAQFAREWVLANQNPFPDGWEGRFWTWYERLVEEAAPVFGFVPPPAFSPRR